MVGSQRVARETFVWSRIQHRNLHPLLGYRSQPQPQLISPWCHHGNLSDYLKANPDLSRLDKLTLVRPRSLFPQREKFDAALDRSIKQLMDSNISIHELLRYPMLISSQRTCLSTIGARRRSPISDLVGSCTVSTSHAGLQPARR